MKTCTLEQAKRLKELGVEQKANSTWTSENDYRYPFGYGYLYGPKDYAAFDTDELLAMMPKKHQVLISREHDKKFWRVKIDKVSIRSKSPSIGIAEILIYMAWNSVSGFTVPEINERIKQYNNA